MDQYIKPLRFPKVFTAKGNVIDSVPELVASIPEFDLAKDRPDCNKLVRFIMVMYDKQSVFIRMFHDIKQRKRECAVYAGYSLEQDEDIINRLFEFSDELFVRLVIAFLKWQNSRVWAMIVSNEQTFYEFQQALLSEVNTFTTDKDKLTAISVKSKLMEDSDVISARLDSYYSMLFGDKDLIEKATKQRYTPEQMAQGNV